MQIPWNDDLCVSHGSCAMLQTCTEWGGEKVTCWVHLPQSLDCGDILLNDVTGCGTCKHTQYLACLQLSECYTRGQVKAEIFDILGSGHTFIILT